MSLDPSHLSTIVETIATITAIMGAALNVTKRYSHSYVMWNVSNLFWMYLALNLQRWGLLATQVVFIGLNSYGLYVQRNSRNDAA